MLVTVVGGVVIGGLIAAVVVLSLRIAATSAGGGSPAPPAAGSGMMGGGMRMNEAMGMSEPMIVWRQGQGTVTDPAQAGRLAMAAVSGRGWGWLRLDEVHIFPEFFEVETDDRNGFKGSEVYVDRSSGDVGPEMGPNTMWDTEYGAGRCDQALSQSGAAAIAVTAVQASFAGTLALGDAERHHGYWEFELRRNGAVVNQINVNNCTRQTLAEQMWQPDMIGTYSPNG